MIKVILSLTRLKRKTNWRLFFNKKKKKNWEKKFFKFQHDLKNDVLYSSCSFEKKNTSHSLMNNVVSSQFFFDEKKKLKTPHYPPLSPLPLRWALCKWFSQFCHNFIFINSKWLIRAAETTPKRKLLLKKLSKNNFHHLLFTFFSKHTYNIIIQKEIRCKSKNIKSFKKN
jgi:hypothetical protein